MSDKQFMKTNQTPIDLLSQVEQQYKVVVHLCKIIGHVHEQLGQRKVLELHDEDFLSEMGRQTAELMEALGDISNGMDIVQPEDKWVNPIYKRARKFWPNDQWRNTYKDAR